MDLIAELFDLCKRRPHPIIAIDGPAGAGKTTLANHLHYALGASMPSHVIHMDDLYHGWKTPFDQHFTDALRNAVEAHTSQQEMMLARFDWNTNTYLAPEYLSPKPLLILEGVASMHSVIGDEISAAIWLEIAPEIGLHRVLARDGAGITDEMQHWLQLQEQHFQVEEPKNRADFILTT